MKKPHFLPNHLNKRVLRDLPVVVDEQLLGGVVVKRVDQLQAEHELVSLRPDVVDMLSVAVVQGLENDNSNEFSISDFLRKYQQRNSKFSAV
jgi:hypothetical protein